jgi:hypothetical protein
MHIPKKLYFFKWWVDQSGPFVEFWDALQLMKLINTNHNPHPNSCKRVSQKWWWTKLGMKNHAWGMGQHASNMHPSNSNTICHLFFTQKCELVFYRGGLKEKQFQIVNKKASIRQA